MIVMMGCPGAKTVFAEWIIAALLRRRNCGIKRYLIAKFSRAQFRSFRCTHVIPRCARAKEQQRSNKARLERDYIETIAL